MRDIAAPCGRTPVTAPQGSAKDDRTATGQEQAMRRRMARATTGTGLWLAVAGALALSACGRPADPHLMRLRPTGNGPDEFAILPTKPLQAPTNYNTLPTPTPGGTNLTDPTPVADAVTALGGRPGAGVSGPGIVRYASRYGVDPTIRSKLATADQQYRRDHRGRLLERLAGQTTYYQAYKPFELDQYAELARWRKLGVRTPSAPPDREKKR